MIKYVSYKISEVIAMINIAILVGNMRKNGNTVRLAQSFTEGVPRIITLR